MSVIAKLRLDGCLDFGAKDSLTKLSCVCENDLMAAYAKADEDRTFTKYSPWGEMKLGHKFVTEEGNTKFRVGHCFYVIVLKDPTGKPRCPGAEHVHPVRCHAIHDFGTTKQVEISRDDWHMGSHQPKPDDHPGVLHWRMSIDNPPAVAFFRPGEADYWVAFYDASSFSISSALEDAHS